MINDVLDVLELEQDDHTLEECSAVLADTQGMAAEGARCTRRMMITPQNHLCGRGLTALNPKPQTLKPKHVVGPNYVTPPPKKKIKIK